MGPRPIDPIPEAFQGDRKRGQKDNHIDPDRIVAERKRIKELVPPSRLHGSWQDWQFLQLHGATSAMANLVPSRSSFSSQIKAASNVSRVFMEDVNGIRQGVVIPFRQGFASGLIGGRMDDEGNFYAGGSDRGWGAHQQQALQLRASRLDRESAV